MKKFILLILIILTPLTLQASIFDYARERNESKHTVVMLLPLTGKDKHLGKALLDAATLSLIENGSDKSNGIIIKPIDTGETDDEWRLAVKQAIYINPSLILGPVFRHQASSLATVTNNMEISVISFSNDFFTLENKGIYLMGFNPVVQLEKAIEFAHNQGIKYFYTIAPDSHYGRVSVEAIRDKLTEVGGIISGIEMYISADAGLSEALRMLLETSGIVTEFPELALNEALIIPEGGKIPGVIASRVKQMNETNIKMRLIGSGAWDDERNGKDKRLIGAWYATAITRQRISFENRFEKFYDYKPHRLSSLAYDSVLIAIELAKEDDFSDWEIRRRKGFQGINGKINFLKNGVSERELSILEITNNGVAVVE